MADPLTREERDDHLRQPLLAAYGAYVESLRDNYEATVHAAEERAERAEKRTERLRAALGQISTGFPLAGYAHSVAMKALAADDAARGER